MQQVIALRGSPYAKYIYGLMKEFHENKEKYENINGYYIYVRRNNMEGPIKVCKLLESDIKIINDLENGPVYEEYIPYNDEIEEHQKKDKYNMYDYSIQVEYNGSNNDLGIEPGKLALVCRNEDGQLYVEHTFSKPNDNLMKFLINVPKRYAFCVNPLPHTINSDGQLPQINNTELYNWN